MAGNLVEIRNLEGYFDTIGGEVHALNGVNVSIEEGKVTGLVGETGSGKTMTAPQHPPPHAGELPLRRGPGAVPWR